MALNDKQKLFGDEYLKDFNGKQAAIRVGYSPRSAEMQASRLLAMPEMQAYIQKKLTKITEKAEITVEKILEDLEELRDMCMGRKPVTKTMVLKDSEGASQPMEVVVTEFEPTAAKGAIELLGKYKKMFTDKIEHSGKIDLESLTDEEIERRIADAERELETKGGKTIASSAARGKAKKN